MSKGIIKPTGIGLRHILGVDWQTEYRDKKGLLIAIEVSGQLAPFIPNVTGRIVYKNSRMKVWGNPPEKTREPKGIYGGITPKGIQIYGLFHVLLDKK